MENEILDYIMNSPENTNPAILGQMLDANSGTKLPEPTPEDNGKVLGVSEGQYALVSGGGGGGSSGLVVHVQRVDDSAILDKTWQEIWDAYTAGTMVVILDAVIENEAICRVVTSMAEADLVVATADGNEYYADTKDGHPYVDFGNEG